MLRVLQENEGAVNSIGLGDLDKDKLAWIDCMNPSAEEIIELSELLKLAKQDLERCLDEDERPTLEDLENFTLVVFKSPVRDPKNVTTTSFSFLISRNLLVTFRKAKVHGVTKVFESEPDKLKTIFSKGTTYIAYQVLERVMDDYFAILDFVEERIDSVEDRVFTSPEPRLVREIFTLKKTLIYFHKSLSSSREVAGNLEKEMGGHIDNTQAKLFRYVYDDVIQLIDVAATYRDILTGTLDIYLGAMSNNMNIVMKKMAAFGALILIPTLISGIYGMNFIHMPELYMKYGYPLSLGLMVFSVVFMTYYFKRKDWF
ncbi:magnesium/cobalt transporter CorA [Nanoarchaeota archaeon]